MADVLTDRPPTSQNESIVATPPKPPTPEVKKAPEPPTSTESPTAKWATTLLRLYDGDAPSVKDGETVDKSFDLVYQSVMEQLSGDERADTLFKLTQIESKAHAWERNNTSSTILPDSAHAFTIKNPATGSERVISSFETQLARKTELALQTHAKAFASDKDPKHLLEIAKLAKFTSDAKRLYAGFSQEEQPTIHELLNELKYLGLTKNLVVEGENSHLISALVKSADFGRLTPEDRGRTDKTTPKNKLQSGENPTLLPTNTPVKDTSGQVLEAIHSQRLFELVSKLTHSNTLSALMKEYQGEPETIKLIEWTAQQTIVRELLPKETIVPQRSIDMSMLQRVKSLGKDDSDDPNFQSSNPLSLWKDPETGRKFVVKHCPEQTLQSDYFGLEILKLAGVPTYEFYYGFVPGENGAMQRVLVSGFLEGFEDPSHLVSIPDNAPEEMAKARLPERLHDNKQIQQALLAEILIGEYNSKAHNFMVLGDSVQHIDQGGALTSTASGKFKGFGETVTMQDIQDVLHCYTDWDENATETINQAYGHVAEVTDGKLVIHNKDMGERLLRQLRSIPQEKMDEALVQAGYVDGEPSITRMNTWIERIKTELLPKYQQKATTNPTKRTDQYIRWLNGAIDTFEKAKTAGGELSYYKQALRTRRASLETIWEEALWEKDGSQQLPLAA